MVDRKELGTVILVAVVGFLFGTLMIHFGLPV